MCYLISIKFRPLLWVEVTGHKAYAVAKASQLRIVRNILIPYCDFENHINDLFKCKWQSEWNIAVNNKLHAVNHWLGLCPKVLEFMREESVLA